MFVLLQDNEMTCKSYLNLHDKTYQEDHNQWNKESALALMGPILVLCLSLAVSIALYIYISLSLTQISYCELMLWGDAK